MCSVSVKEVWPVCLYVQLRRCGKALDTKIHYPNIYVNIPTNLLMLIKLDRLNVPRSSVNIIKKILLT